MKELKHSLTPFSPTGKVIGDMLRPITPPGPPVYTIPYPEDLGFPGRKDTMESLTPSQINESIFTEGTRLAGFDVVYIGDGKEILVFNTSVASTHSLLSVSYEEWEKSFRRQAENLNFNLSHGLLIQGNNSDEGVFKPPAHVPLDMITWVMVRDMYNQTYWPCDINDLTSIPTGNPDIDKFKLQLNDEQINTLATAIVRRNKLAINTLLDIHNNTLCAAMPFLRTKSEADLMIGALSGYYRGDEAKGLGQYEYDHRGKGPMSNPTLHFRITDHFTMKDANILDQENPRMSFTESIKYLNTKYPDYFKGGIDFCQIKPESLTEDTYPEVLARLMKDKRFSPYDLIKSIDPYGSLAHHYLGTWLKDELDNIFRDISHETSLFADHTEDYERELRVSEGATIKFYTSRISKELQHGFTANTLARVCKWIGQTLYPMWDDINNFVQRKVVMSQQEKAEYLAGLKMKYNLPDDFIPVLRQLHPTEKQLMLLREEEELAGENSVYNVAKLDNLIRNYQIRKALTRDSINILRKQLEGNEGNLDMLIDYLTWIQAGQLYDYSNEPEESDRKINQGYNITGTPGTAITYHFDESGDLVLNIGWLLSTKGLSELWLGTILKRKERRDR